jgi:acetyl esterase/lipase
MQSTDRIDFRGLRHSSLGLVLVAIALLFALVAVPAFPADAGQVPEVDVYTDIAYTDPVPAGTLGNLLDLYVPDMPGDHLLPVVIWTSGSAWFSDNGKAGAAPIAEIFNPLGYAVVGVSVRSSFQVKFPGQLFDVRAAIRWLRENASGYGLDPDRIAIMGNSSGGWVSAIAATTSNIHQLPGEPDVGGVSSAVQASVPFFPPTDFLRMNDEFSVIDHDSPTSPESLLVGCQIQTCPEATQLANPITYVDGGEPTMLILHGTADPLVPHGQSVLLYEALKAFGQEATFVSVAGAGHSHSQIVAATDVTVFETRAGNERVSDGPLPTWEMIEDFIRVALDEARGERPSAMALAFG